MRTKGRDNVGQLLGVRHLLPAATTPTAGARATHLVTRVGDFNPPSRMMARVQIDALVNSPKNLVHFADLGPIQSFATTFSWTSRVQNHNLHVLNSIWTAFHQDLTTGSRDIQDFVKKNPENPHALLASICPAVVLIKYCCSTEKAISVSTSHMILS